VKHTSYSLGAESRAARLVEIDLVRVVDGKGRPSAWPGSTAPELSDDAPLAIWAGDGGGLLVVMEIAPHMAYQMLEKSVKHNNGTKKKGLNARARKTKKQHPGGGHSGNFAGGFFAFTA
jgi:hypothetical protein